MIGDESAPLGSAFKPIMIDVDEGECHYKVGQPDSAADTVINSPTFS